MRTYYQPESAGILFEMASLTSDITGISPDVFCSPKGETKHECRIKVSNLIGKMSADDIFSIELKDLTIRGHCRLNSDQLESVKWWIHRNKFVILDYWKSKINTRDFLNLVKPIK